MATEHHNPETGFETDGAQREQRRQQVRERLHWLGMTIDAWAKANGYKPKQVYRVLSGANKGLYGKAHDIAVKLALKEGEVRQAEEPEWGLADAHLILRLPTVGSAKCDVCGGDIAGCRPVDVTPAESGRA